MPSFFEMVSNDSVKGIVGETACLIFDKTKFEVSSSFLEQKKDFQEAAEEIGYFSTQTLKVSTAIFTGILLLHRCCLQQEVRSHIQYQHSSDVEFCVESDSGIRFSKRRREV